MEDLKPVLDSLDGVIANLESSLKPAEKEKAETGSDPTPANANGADGADDKPAEKKKQKKKKEKKPKPPAEPALPVEATQFNQCDLRVGRVHTVAPHPEADGLYALRVAYAPDAPVEETKSVCAGMRKFLTEAEMQDRLVVTICNLKPRKLRGIDSEAMILAGSVKSADEGAKETVVPLGPPDGAVEGDFVSVKDLQGERAVVEGKFVSSKVWDKVVNRFAVKDGAACYDGNPLLVRDSNIVCALPDGAEIH